jgi:hypothetical protein
VILCSVCLVTTTIGGLLVLARMADDAVLRNLNAHMNSSERQSAGMGGEGPV